MATPLRVLLIEDSELDAQLVVRCLESADYSLDWLRVDTVPELKSALAEREWDIILSDHSLPGFTSLDALKVVNETGLDVPVILVSGSIGEEAAVTALRAGANDYILKDNLTRLVPAIERELRDAAARREREQAERLARQSRQSFVSALNALHSHIAILDGHGRILAVNDAWRDFALANNFPSDDAAVGWNYLEVCDHAAGMFSEDAHKVADGIRSVMVGETRDFVFEYPCHSPTTPRWFIIRVTRFHTEDGPRVVVAHELITERKLAEEALKASEARFKAIFEHAPAIMFLKDVESRYILANRRLEVFLGKPSSEIIGKTDRDLFPSEAAEAILRHDAELFWKNQPTQFEETVPGINGPVTFLTTKFPICDDHGVPLMLCGIATDVSERKALERQLVESQRMDAVGHLAAGVAHDFNNLLQSILAYSQFIQAAVEDRPMVCEDVERVINAAKRAADLTRQLLAFSRQTDIRASSIGLAPVVKETIKLLERTIPSSVSIRSEIEHGVPNVYADATQIQQVLINLCVNAKDAMPSGGVMTISLRRAPIADAPPDLQREEDAHEAVVLSVTDNGVGIAPEHIPRLYEPFFTTKGPGEGTGLGLPTSYGIVKQHGGVITCQSRLGSGSTFEVWLVAQSSASANESAASGVKQLPGGAETILVVDDQESIRLLGRRVLEDLGYRILVAQNGQEALEVYNQRKDEIALTVLDVQMPLVDGLECCDQIRRAHPDARVILSSGYYDPKVMNRIRNLGVSEFLPKPYTVEQLAHKVREVLDRP